MKKFTNLSRLILTILFILTSSLVLAASDAIVGDWHSHDKKTGKPSSVISIWEKDGKYFGKISKIYAENGAKSNDVCEKCKGTMRNKPILGMTILRDLEPVDGKYKHGKILDPRNGKDYSCVLSLSKDGKTLYVRGYVGISLFGRTATWTREV